MSIGKQIKQRRLELNMSQEMLAEKIGISRSAVSNWEIERNYPDLQIIVALSDLLDIPLDSLLKEDSEIVENIAHDTTERKKQSKKIILLYIAIIVLVFTLGFLLVRTNYLELSDASQIDSVLCSENMLTINTKLSRFRSLNGYYIDKLPDKTTMTITLITKRNLFQTPNNQLTIPLDDFGNINQVLIVHKGKCIEKFYPN